MDWVCTGLLGCPFLIVVTVSIESQRQHLTSRITFTHGIFGYLKLRVAFTCMEGVYQSSWLSSEVFA